MKLIMLQTESFELKLQKKAFHEIKKGKQKRFDIEEKAAAASISR